MRGGSSVAGEAGASELGTSAPFLERSRSVLDLASPRSEHSGVCRCDKPPTATAQVYTYENERVNRRRREILRVSFVKYYHGHATNGHFASQIRIRFYNLSIITF